MDETIQRISSPGLEAILGKQIKVLDDGFIRVVDYMGGDSSIVQAARVSYGSGTKTVNEDRKLIRYLIENHHTTPLEMCEIKLHVRVPMDTWRQWVRHRTASVNEYSTRYSLAIDSFSQTPADSWRMQSTTNRQGSGHFCTDMSVGRMLSDEEKQLHELSRSVYKKRIELGIAREQARKDLPLSTYTEAYWKMDLHNLLNFLRLRMAPDAQYEIRQYANVIGQQIVSKWCPMVWEAFNDLSVKSFQFTPIESKIVAEMFKEGSVFKGSPLESELQWGDLCSNRSFIAFKKKLSDMGVPVSRINLFFGIG
jgi:thymidylate synthase (FAD)